MRILIAEDDAMCKQKMQQNSSSRSATVQALTKTMKVRDHVPEGHASRIQEYVQHMGQALGLSEERIKDLGLLAQFHYLGKVYRGKCGPSPKWGAGFFKWAKASDQKCLNHM
ncbi:MAG: hypothetical protein U5L00_06920 [Desulfovermiculus sp.]|nr:hypothetical protein [Desulfovermiculus sp.]